MNNRWQGLSFCGLPYLKQGAEKTQGRKSCSLYGVRASGIILSLVNRFCRIFASMTYTQQLGLGKPVGVLLIYQLGKPEVCTLPFYARFPENSPRTTFNLAKPFGKRSTT
ncbi:hypothetical protein EFB08_14175 [Rufibacter latericius]|uniref:Uncharacterized protein n=1 Tax=Rufibacter latericius TaxID=2487040 RepID=A0A3M9MKD6_9BACT|nr:hypothetical protein EFB08_14175 [Rufibacter latericius]